MKDQIAARLQVDPPLLHRLLVNFLREEAGKFGYTRGVVGLSGGVDSALAGYLSVQAFGAQNVLAVLMPYRTSSPDSVSDAMLLVEEWGVPYQRIEITPMLEPFFQMNSDMDRRRRGNLMARMRMIVLYDQSAEFGGLVIGTSNKSELLLGYGTLFGDMASAINPLGDLYKTQIWQVARAWGLPERIVAKVPTADLWPEQTDEEELGLRYREADQILYLLYDERYAEEEVVALGYDPQRVARLAQLVRQVQFKRIPPVIAKVSRRTIGHDFLYERDWGQ